MVIKLLNSLLHNHLNKIKKGDRLLIGTGTGQLLEYDIKEPLGKS